MPKELDIESGSRSDKGLSAYERFLSMANVDDHEQEKLFCQHIPSSIGKHRSLENGRTTISRPMDSPPGMSGGVRIGGRNGMPMRKECQY